MSTPPRLAVWLLARRLPPADRDEVIGDLHEEFLERATIAGCARATRWNWPSTGAVVEAAPADSADQRSGKVATDVHGRRSICGATADETPWDIGDVGRDPRMRHWRGGGDDLPVVGCAAPSAAHPGS